MAEENDLSTENCFSQFQIAVKTLSYIRHRSLILIASLHVLSMVNNVLLIQNPLLLGRMGQCSVSTNGSIKLLLRAIIQDKGTNVYAPAVFNLTLKFYRYSIWKCQSLKHIL